MTRVVYQIITEIPENQFGFMRDRGTKNAIFILKMLSERANQHQRDVFMVFIDYKKAFDKVKHQDLFKMLEKIQIDNRDLRVIKNLYNEQVAAVRMPDKSTTAWTRIRRGVRQGCVISPDLFNLYTVK